MLSRFTPRAGAFRETIPPDIQERLLDNAWCSHCSGMTTITDYSGTIENGDLILDGFCILCGNAVTRLIESEE
ncbi:hypothetical protein KKC74_01335 [bacterium]|nr:hypothetical protein [bacterium]MBU1873217.1 hypothetical protein [bacterium]